MYIILNNCILYLGVKFQESLVLMKNILCWDSNDVKNLKLNARKVNAVGLPE